MSTTTAALVVGSGLQTNTTTRPTEDGIDSWVNSTEPRITFLSMFILSGFLGNLCLIVTICHSRRFRSAAFYVFIVNLAVVNICECVFNMAVVLSTSIRSEWNYGDIVCNMNAFFINFIAIETILSLTIITSDRMIAVRYRGKYEQVVSTPRFSILICFTWCQSFAFGMPIALGVVNPSVYKNLYYCTLHTGTSVIYSAFTAFFCYIMPIAISVSFYIYIVRTGYKERFVVRALLAQQNYNEDSHEEPKIRREIRYSKLTVTLFAAWVLLEGPYILTEYFRQFQNSSELEGTQDESLEYAWHVDVVLLWLRFGYIVVLPAAAFLWIKELWKSFKDLVLCRKNNAVVDASSKNCEIEVSPLENNLKEDHNVKHVFTQSKEQRVFQVPVLFATSHGVHIKTSSENDISDWDECRGKIRGKKCDVGSRGNLNVIEDDAIDYDSGNELDPYSMSHPISAKQLDCTNDLSLQRRSASQPEVRDEPGRQPPVGKTTVGCTSTADSGLDLSSGNTYSGVFRPLESVPYETLQTCISEVKSPVDKMNCNEFSVVTEESALTEARHSRIPICEDNVNQRQDDATIDFKEDIQPNSLIQKSKLSLKTDTTKVSRIGETDHSEIQPDNLLYKTDTVSTVICKAELWSNMLTGRNTIPPHVTVKTNNNSEVTSPETKRKKKKRREKCNECFGNGSSSDTNSPMLPPRPPPRLAPIASTINKLLYSNSMRAGSSCSSLCPMLDNNPATIHYAYTHLDTQSCSGVDAANDSDTVSCDLDPVSCSHEDNEAQDTSRQAGEHANNMCITDAASDHQITVTPDTNHRPLLLDFIKQSSTDQEDVVSPSDCYMKDVLHNYALSNEAGGAANDEIGATETDTRTGVINQGYVSSDEGNTEDGSGTTVVASCFGDTGSSEENSIIFRQ